MHPVHSLFTNRTPPITLAACDHYAGAERLMRKSLAIQADKGAVFDVTLDCEDGAALGHEIEHAHLVAQLVQSEENVFQRAGVRVHAPSNPHFSSDLDIILDAHARKQPAYLVLPKIQDFQEAVMAIAHVRTHCAQRALLCPPIHILIETLAALDDAGRIASLPEVECLSFGIMDFVSEHAGAIPDTAMRSPEQFSHPLVAQAKLRIANACHRYGKVASHNVTTDFATPGQTLEDARTARSRFGFTRMWSIHPSQIDSIIEAHAPSSLQLQQAIEILDVAALRDWGPISLNGRLHDRASYRYYWLLLKRAQLSGASLSADVAERFDLLTKETP